MEIKELYQKYLECTGVGTDTRKIESGTMFFALKGGNFNGNAFAEEALNKGVKYVVIDEVQYKKDDRYLLADDALKSLQALANFHRRQLNIPVLAITGSNGKTTTKELISAVLSRKFKVYATKGNLNNHIGIPLTLLSIDSSIEMAVVEMGANHQREIASYCEYTEPDFGLITNIGKAHLEGFGGEEGVKKGKGELFDYLLAKGRKAFVNTTDPKLVSINKFNDALTYPGKNDYCHVEFIEASPNIVFKTESGKKVQTQLIGAYNFINIAAALCVGKYFGVKEEDALEAVAAYNPDNNRSQVINKGSISIILDAYNANPSSMKAALENFGGIKAGKKVVIIGDMFELGDESEKEHREIGKLLKALSFDEVFLCGKQMEYTKAEIPTAKYFSAKQDLQAELSRKSFDNATILIKGSRGMGLETLLEVIE
ncbi:MAG: UDP-N-acetylmuramoyl-tripeptide--D-alanyl-D-alanine ligase [Cytophagaceae bacterium]